MKLITINVLILVTFVLSACDEKSEKFAGFTVVNTNKETAQFYIDTNTIKRRNSGVVSFNMVRVLPNGYAIQIAETDCKTNFSSFEGVKYRDDGMSEEKFIAETLTLPNKDNSDINALVKMACDKAEENRIITGAFDDSKALEILYGSYQPTTHTALWEVIEPPITLEGYESFSGKSGTVKILDSKDFIEQGKAKHVLLTSTLVDDSPQALLSATVFVKTGDKWRIEAEYPYLKIAKDGEPKILHWERIGKEHYGVIEANTYKTPKSYTDSKGYIVMYELNVEGLNNLLFYSENNVLKYSEFVDNNKNVNITFPESNKTYWDATITISKGVGQTQEVYRFQNGSQVPLSLNALKELYGISDPSGKVKTAYDKLSSVWFEQSFKNGKDNLHVIFIKTQSLDNKGEIDACHVCAVAIGAITYKLIDNQWQIVSKQPKFIDRIGYWGDAPEIKQAEILQLSPNNLALMVNESDTHMGVTDEWMDLFTYYKNNWRNLGSIVTGNTDCMHPNEKDDDCRSSFKGKISTVNDKKSEYPDLLVKRTGTVQDDKGNVFTAKNTVYFFNGTAYEEKQQKKAVNSALVSMPKASTEQTTSSADTPQMLVMRMLEYALNDGGISHESEIQQTKLQIESLPRPAKGNKKAARAINDNGLASSKGGDFNNAAKLFEEANKLDKSDIEIASNLGFAYLKQGNLDSAQQTITMALTMSPGRATAWENLGDVFGLKGDVTKAVACFSNTYRFSKNRLKTHQYMKKLNEKEDVENLKQARAQAINWAEKSYPNI